MSETAPPRFLPGSSPGTPALSFVDVTLAQGARILLEGACFSLPEGSLTVLTGANGHGKTTLFRTILGLHAPRKGEVRIFGRIPDTMRGAIGYLPQDRRLPAPQMTGRTLIASSWNGTRPGLPGWGRRIRQRVDGALSRAGALHLADRPLGQLSGGERQRVFLAGALLQSPRLLVLDEPLSGVDVQGQAEIVALLHDLCRRSGVTILLSCHGLDAVRGRVDYRLAIAGQTLELSDAAL